MNLKHTPSTFAKRRISAGVIVCVALILVRDLLIPTIAISASTFSPTLLVNTEAFVAIDDDDGTANVVLRFGDTLAKTLTFNRTTDRFEFNDDVYVTGMLRATGTVSGATIFGTQSLRSSGSVVWEGAASGTTLTVTGAADFDGALTFGDTIADTISVNAGTWTFANDTNFALSGGQNALSFDTDTFSVDATLDRIGIGTTTPNAKLQVVGVVSGVTLYARSFSGAGLTDCDTEASSKLMWDRTTGRFSCGADQTGGSSGGGIQAHYVLASGDTMTGTLVIQNGTTHSPTTTPLLNVRGVMSGVTLKTTNGISSSGAVALESSLTGATLKGFGLTDCDTPTTSKLLYDLTTGKFSCGSDGGGSAPSLTRINGSSGAAGADITWQNLTSNSADCTTTALCSAVMTTTGLGVGTWKYKYTLIYQTAVTTTGIGFGIDHTGTVGQVQHMWYHLTTGGAAATGVGDNDTATVAGQLMEGKQEGVDNTLIGSATAGVAVINTDIIAIVEGIIVVTASGDLQLKIASEVGSTAVRIMADSTLELVKIE